MVTGPERTEDVFDRNWANAIIATALNRLEADQPEGDRREMFPVLKPLLTGDGTTPYAVIADRFRTTEGALRVAVHRLRRQFGDTLRATIGETVADAAEIADELRHLLAVVSRRP